MEQTKSYPVLYILMRSDMDSLNPGKACSQSAHAANQFVFNLVERPGTNTPADQVIKMDLFERWREATGQGFGTTVTLDVTGDMLPKVVLFARTAGFEAAVTHDPTYPLKDGSTLHVFPLDTCGYIFGEKAELEPLLRQFNLLA